MSDWLHNLPVPLMALVIFGFTYLLAGAIFAGIALVATGERAKSLKAISPGMEKLPWREQRPLRPQTGSLWM